MSRYTFTNTEINNKKASEFETKSLLYLLGMRDDSDEIEIITVDCFNDVTGADENFNKLWDVQSKNHSSLPPSKIGESLLTLYNNYISSIEFIDYILFIPKLNREYLINPLLSVYNYDNITNKQKLRIEKKLKEKINRGESDSPPLFNDFLSHVTFVEDNKEISTYIKTISKFRNKRSVSDEVYLRIFNEIRDKQAALKNSYIEHETISHPSEVLRFNRHIRKKEIHTLLINRIVGIDVFNFNAIPFPFLTYINDKDPEDIEDIIQECNENLSRAFFDKNASKEFWKISERIITILKNDLNTSPLMVYDKITSKIKIKTTYLTKYTLLYMTSIIITGLKNDN